MTERSTAGVRTAPSVALVPGCAVSGALAGWLTGRTVGVLTESASTAWLLGRAAGVTAYLLLFTVVLLGLVLAHPWAVGLRRPGPEVRLRIHVSLAAFAATFTLLHVVVLATDEHARVGWTGALAPMASGYRPVAVTLGVLGLYAGLAAGLTAALAGRMAGRIWLPIHRVAGVSLVLVWAHSVLAGTDTPALFWMYAATALVLLAIGASRYLARSPQERLAELTREVGGHPLAAVHEKEPTR